MTIQTENLCKLCMYEERLADYPHCIDCDHRINKITHHNNFRQKKSEFQKWFSGKSFIQYNPGKNAYPNTLAVTEELKDAWNAALDAAISLLMSVDCPYPHMSNRIDRELKER